MASAPRAAYARCEFAMSCCEGVLIPSARSVHDPSTIKAPNSAQESHSDTLDSPGSATQPSSQLHSNIEDDGERNIFPVTWRVIGGGVMMGGRSTNSLIVFYSAHADRFLRRGLQALQGRGLSRGR